LISSFFVFSFCKDQQMTVTNGRHCLCSFVWNLWNLLDFVENFSKGFPRNLKLDLDFYEDASDSK
jgi:hypothetical protein